MSDDTPTAYIPPGKPTKRTPENKKFIEQTIRETGCSYASAARRAGMSPKTFEAWRREEPVWREELEAIRSQFLAGVEKQVIKAGDEDWRAAAHVLERRDPENWGKQITVKHEIVLELPSLLSGPMSEPDFDWDAYEEVVRKKAALQADVESVEVKED